MSEQQTKAGFSALGKDIKEARKAKGLSRQELAEMVDIVPRYLANIENSGSLPSLPVLCDLVTICNLPVEKYFYPPQEAAENPQRERIIQKLKSCDEKYLPVLENTLDALLKINEAEAIDP